MQVSAKKKKHSSSSPIVSTNCSRLKSFHLSCKPHFLCSKSSDHHLVSDPLPRNPSSTSTTTLLPPPKKCSISDGKDAAEEYWKRAEQLEIELKKLDKWLDTEKKLRDSLNNRINETCSAQFEVKTTGKRCGRKTRVEAVELIRVAGGGYVHKFSTSALCRTCPNLAIQVSPLVMLPMEDGLNISQVLKRMNEMGRENMTNWLLKSMPLPDISSMEIVDGSPITPCSDSSEEGFLEAIFVRATEELKRLVVEGLQIKNGSAEKVENKDMQKKKDEIARECIIEVMLIQVRDPNKHYRAVGNLMVGFVEASVTDAEESGFFIEHVYVAGINSAKRDYNGNENENFLWYIST